MRVDFWRTTEAKCLSEPTVAMQWGSEANAGKMPSSAALGSSKEPRASPHVARVWRGENVRAATQHRPTGWVVVKSQDADFQGTSRGFEVPWHNEPRFVDWVYG